MSNLSIRKKSINTWLHTDSVFGDFIISKFYFNSFFAKFQIVEEGNTRLEQYEIANITLYDDTDGGVAETFSTITELSLRLEELQYPAFDRTGTSVFPSMEQITNVNVTDVEDGQVLAWDVATSKWVNITIGSGTTPNLQEVTDVGATTDKDIAVNSIRGNGVPFTIKDETTETEDAYIFEGGTTPSLTFDKTLLTDVRWFYYPDSDGYCWVNMDIPAIGAFTATNSVNYQLRSGGSTTFTDPTGVNGFGYTVFVVNGTATIGGVGYTAGSLVYRFYHSGVWSSTNISGGSTPTLQQVTDVGATTTNAISTGGVGINTTTPDAIFDVVSTSSGILIPRMTTTQRNAISTPVNSMLIYNTTTTE